MEAIRVITRGKPKDEWGKLCQKACDDIAKTGKSSIIISTEEFLPGKLHGRVAMTLMGMDKPILTYGLARNLVYMAKRDPKVREILEYIIDIVNEELNKKDEKEEKS